MNPDSTQYVYPDTLPELFNLGMKRNVREPMPPEGPNTLELGPGNTPMGTMHTLDRMTGHNLETDRWPFTDHSLDAVYAFHVLEHLTGEGVLFCMAEAQRKLKIGACMNIVVPYYSSQLWHQDQDHKSTYTERTWERLFDNPYYTRDQSFVDWHWDVRVCVIMATEERNLALITQLQRVP